MAQPDTVTQPTWLPTRKLTGALVAAALWEVAGPHIVSFVALALGLPVGGPAATAVLQIAIAAAVGYFIKDKPNV